MDAKLIVSSIRHFEKWPLVIWIHYSSGKPLNCWKVVREQPKNLYIFLLTSPKFLNFEKFSKYLRTFKYLQKYPDICVKAYNLLTRDLSKSAIFVCY